MEVGGCGVSGGVAGGVGLYGCGGFLTFLFFFFFKQKTAYEIVSRDWSSDVCSSDLPSGQPWRWLLDITHLDHGSTSESVLMCS